MHKSPPTPRPSVHLSSSSLNELMASRFTSTSACIYAGAAAAAVIEQET